MKSDNFLNNLIGYLYLKLRGNKIEKKERERRIAQMSRNSLVGSWPTELYHLLLLLLLLICIIKLNLLP